MWFNVLILRINKVVTEEALTQVTQSLEMKPQRSGGKSTGPTELGALCYFSVFYCVVGGYFQASIMDVL